MVETTEKKMAVSNKEDTEKWLTDNGITFNTTQHEPVMTIAAMMDIVKFEGVFASTKFAKNLFNYDKKNKDSMFLIVAAHDAVFNMNLVAKHLGVSSGNFRGADADRMWDALGAKAGGVNIFALMNDPECKVKVVIDQTLLSGDFEYVGFHPMQNDYTTAIKPEDLKKIIELSKHEPLIVDFTTLQQAGEAAPATKEKKPQQEKKAKQPKEKVKKDADVHELGIEYPKEVDFSKWYSQIITKSGMIEYYDISGCYVLRPPSFFIWEQITAFFDARIKKMGVQNCYFPMFVSEASLNKEKSHIEGFSPEVAWVTKSGKSDLAEPIAIRPTSETIMYPSFAKWIQSHRDLPMKLNQWTNVVRWEFKHPTPFIRTREFLWQEGHTAHATREEAVEFTHLIQDEYTNIYQDLLACPVIPGRKSEDERFAGADLTTTCELYVPVSGRGIQGATSHMLGQNFSKMFNVSFEDENKQKQFAWQTSWGISTRSIGAMIMIHSDNKGVVLPPKVAQTQVVIIPIFHAGEDHTILKNKAHEIAKALKESGVRAQVDDSENHNPGFKYAQWEVRGTPVRLELGPKDLAADVVTAAIRHSGKKFTMKQDGIVDEMAKLLLTIHQEMFDKALAARADHMPEISDWDSFMKCLNKKDICLAPWCDTVDCEVAVKDKSKEQSLAMMESANEGEVQLTGSAKTLCVPYKMKEPAADSKCFHCGNPAKVTALWGRSY